MRENFFGGAMGFELSAVSHQRSGINMHAKSYRGDKALMLTANG
ncbi:MAG: hypothetical protein QM763_09310 [Agriterribacter sp.]